MTQEERDRLVVLRKARDKKITQREASLELQVTERHLRRMLVKLKQRGDKAVVHGLRGGGSNRSLSPERRQEIERILSEPVYAGFGPTLAAEYLESRHGITVGRETVRKLMSSSGLWRSKRRRVEAIHQWRSRRSRFGEMVQWDTSDHDWLEGRGPRLKLIRLIDDATSRSMARFVEHDSTAENLGLLEQWLLKNGRMVSCYTDKASLFVTTQKQRRDRPGEEVDSREMPPTQIGRALRELDIVWIGAHSPQAKGRVERSFATDQDRLVKGLRVAGARTLEEANQYLNDEYGPWWEANCTVRAAHPDDAHRALGREHNLESILSHVESRKVLKDYTVRYRRRIYRIERDSIVTGLRDGEVRVEQRRDGGLEFVFRGKFLRWREGVEAEKLTPEPAKEQPLRKAPLRAHETPWRQGYKGLKPRPVSKAAGG